MATETRTCRSCKAEKPLDSFRLAKAYSGKLYRRYRCKPCEAVGLKLNPRTPEVQRRYKLKAAYGLTLEQYAAMLTSQNGRCAICLTDKEPNQRWPNELFHVDHDHKTGAIRGLLCSRCNSGLAMYKDDPVILSRAITYLVKKG